MDNPRAEKVAVVNKVRDRLEASDGAVLTEYRGLTVAELAAMVKAESTWRRRARASRNCSAMDVIGFRMRRA